MLGFGGNNDLATQLRHQREEKELDADVQMAQQMFDPNKVALDSQVSALILEMNNRFLKYRIDAQSRSLICDEKYGFIEPWGEESRCFLEGNYPKIVGEIDMLLAEIYKYSKQYDTDMSGAFNELVRVRMSMLGLSRATGKAAKVAKSQFVESTAFVKRDIFGKKENKGLLGLGMFGL